MRHVLKSGLIAAGAWLLTGAGAGNALAGNPIPPSARYEESVVHAVDAMCDGGGYDGQNLDTEAFRQHFPQGFLEEALPDSTRRSTRMSYHTESTPIPIPKNVFDPKKQQWIQSTHWVVQVRQGEIQLNFYTDEQATIMKCVSHTLRSSTSEYDPDARKPDWEEFLDALVRWTS